MVEFLGNIFYNQAVQNWLLFFVILIVAIIFGKILYTFFKHVVEGIASKTRTKFDDAVIAVLEGPLVFLVFLAAFWYALPLLNLDEGAEKVIRNILVVTIILTITFFVTRLSDKVIEVMISDRGIGIDKKTRKLLPVIQRIARIIIFIVAALVIFDVLGLSITSLLAGLGLVGLTVALAAKDTLSNLFGSFSVMTDQAFKVGDRIKVDKYEGTVDDIGLRSTKIQTSKNTKVIVPNTKLASSILENVSQKENRRREVTLILKPNTKADKIEEVIKEIKKLLEPLEIEEKKQVNLTNLSPAGPVISVVYWLENVKGSKEFHEQILFSIKRELEKAGIELASSNQTSNSQ
ncbi:mechanosensitive ion channel family protein [Patescibacteria group bacterium]